MNNLDRHPATETPLADLRAEFHRVRGATERLAEPLAPEDCVLQSMPEASPTRWHLAHTTWFFETFLLKEGLADYEVFHPLFHRLFNSYYNTIGDPFPRPQRGLLSRPTVNEVLDYRAYVDDAMARLLEDHTDLHARVVLGLAHEEQHQELILTDLKHALARNPIAPVYRNDLQRTPGGDVPALEWIEFGGGEVSVGRNVHPAHDPESFAFDNEGPEHRTLLEPFAVGNRLVTCGEWLEFMGDGGYERTDLWLADGWAHVLEEGWRSPLYWREHDGDWWEFTLGGLRRVDPAAPVAHVSYYEADAYAAWAGARLPSEAEWEVVARAHWPTADTHGLLPGNLLEADYLHPRPLGASDAQVHQLAGDVWEWTSSSYSPYPRYETPSGAIGEYNGKFMCNQQVLRGGSCATPRAHIRPTYRNFFYPPSRWQFSGLRLARGAG